METMVGNEGTVEERRGEDEETITDDYTDEDTEKKRYLLKIPDDMKDEFLDALKTHIEDKVKDVLREETEKILLDYSIETAKNIDREFKEYKYMLNVDLTVQLEKLYEHDQALMVFDETLEKQAKDIIKLKGTHYKYKVFKPVYSRLFRYMRINRATKTHDLIESLKEESKKLKRELDLLKTEQGVIKQNSHAGEKIRESAKKYDDLLETLGAGQNDELEVYVDRKYTPNQGAKKKKLRKKVTVTTKRN